MITAYKLLSVCVELAPNSKTQADLARWYHVEYERIRRDITEDWEREMCKRLANVLQVGLQHGQWPRFAD